ncbi:MAG: hypothetical protein CM15mP117_25230 [Alphaproteobacteria bacterium]|nr:MAG: hypothetical protein CM15mP117_25230 [Alphaproteobacteria bacterium]
MVINLASGSDWEKSFGSSTLNNATGMIILFWKDSGEYNNREKGKINGNIRFYFPNDSFLNNRFR